MPTFTTNAQLITLNGPLLQPGIGPATQRRMRLMGLAYQNNIHLSGGSFNSNAAIRAFAATANTAMNAATADQCRAAILRMYLENGNLLTTGVSPTTAQMQTILSVCELLKGWNEDDLMRMETYALGVQAEVVGNQ